MSCIFLFYGKYGSYPVHQCYGEIIIIRKIYSLIFFHQKTKGGVLLPEKSVGKMMEATVVAIGDGARDRVI